MGVLLWAECPTCGHEAELFAGSGFKGLALEPRICLDCRDIVSVAVEDRFGRLDPDGELNHCPSCGGTNFQQFGYDAANATETLPSVRTCSCPKCGGSVHVDAVGTWD